MPITALLRDSNADSNVGIIQYNGYKLCPARRYTFNVEPVYDRSGRTIISRKFLLKGVFLVYAGDNLSNGTSPAVAAESTAMEAVRNALSVPGKDLILTGLGFGNMSVGPTQGNLKDVDFGPKPHVLSCDPVGCLMAWEVEWLIEWQLGFSNQTATNVGLGAIIAFNYETETDTDHRGLTVRTVSGYWQVSAAGLPSTNITGASSLKSTLLVTVPKGFRRRRQKFKDNDAKNICNFSFVDEELSGRAFPQGIVEADVDYELESETLSFAKWRATISGTLESKPGAPRTLATEKFMAIVLKKVATLRAAFKSAGRGMVIPEKFRIKGGMFNRRYSFSFSFRAVGCLKDIIVSSGMYDALPDSNWERWAGSLKEVWQPGGTCNLSVPIEIIFSPGDPLSGHPINATATGYNDTAGKFSGVFAVGDIDEDGSWLEFENYVRAVSTSAYEIQKISQEVSAVVSAGSSSGGAAFGVAAGIGARLLQQPDAPKPDQIKYTGKATQYVLQYGKALRVKYPVKIPVLDKVGDGKAIIVDQEIEPSVQVSTVGSDDVPVFAARWAQLYQVPEGYARYLPASQNPVHCPVPGKLDGQT